ncbi:phosphodiester glycosidase family protein [Paenibacillus spiritus]|uniref:Phosphodiester glycosidase family protein n=1 Tax=Paenibacillus spiritus TaxID=2496557 RepID=A0A5J5FXD6_9BACL|nr:phosphodiester glycosidase family protein [Paenibacillus spiritus]KAA8998794.1 phosphodiester glycosidase family protein [Paenibacillus spiritus]
MKIKRPFRRRWILIPAVLLTLGGTAYGLADRYLIDHVEAVVAQPAPEDARAAETAAEQAANAVSDDWNYRSDNMSISITKKTEGSGSSAVIYYVADVQVSDASMLQSAFAQNSFGTNITENTSEIASDHGAVLAINGDYYGFRDDGVVIRNGVLYRNKPAREGVALYKDGTMASYEEPEVSAEKLLEDGALQTFSFGPALIRGGKIAENLDSVKIDTNFGNRGISNANPRTGIGMIAPNHYVFVVVDGRSSESRGMTLNEFADLMADLGATEAYNLDGGGSSTLYFKGRVVNNPQGKGQERGVSDILYLGEG